MPVGISYVMNFYKCTSKSDPVATPDVPYLFVIRSDLILTKVNIIGGHFIAKKKKKLEQRP